MQKQNVNAAYAANEKEGEAVAAQYGGVQDNNWLYYNSDYYYKEEEMRDLIRQTIQEMAGEWETGGIDFDQVEKNPALALAGGLEYNKVWQHHAFQGRVASLTDINAVPPKDFTFFYQDKKVPGWDDKNRPEYQKGCVEISYKEKNGRRMSHTICTAIPRQGFTICRTSWTGTCPAAWGNSAAVF